MSESLRSALKQLRLSGALESLDVRLHEAAGNNLNHAEFLPKRLRKTPSPSGLLPPYKRVRRQSELFARGSVYRNGDRP